MKTFPCLATTSLLLALTSPALAQVGFVAATWTNNEIFTLDANMASLSSFKAGSDLPNGITTDGATIWSVHFTTGQVFGYDMLGAPLFSWPVIQTCNQGLTYISPTEIGVHSCGVVDFYDPLTGSWLRSVPLAPDGIEAMTYDGTYLWEMGNSGIYGCDVNTGAVLVTLPNPAGGCGFGGTGLANSGVNELTLACVSGDWFRVDKTTGATLGSGNNGLDMYGLAAIPGTLGGPIGKNYCGPANKNSTNQSAVISAFGSDVAADNFLELTASMLPVGQFGYFLNSDTQGFTPFPPGSSGNLCLGGGIGRHNKQVMKSDNAGEIMITVDLTNLVRPGGSHSVVAGETWNFQCWFRDTPAATSNFTDGIEIQFN